MHTRCPRLPLPAAPAAARSRAAAQVANRLPSCRPARDEQGQARAARASRVQSRQRGVRRQTGPVLVLSQRRPPTWRLLEMATSRTAPPPPHHPWPGCSKRKTCQQRCRAGWSRCDPVGGWVGGAGLEVACLNSCACWALRTAPFPCRGGLAAGARGRGLQRQRRQQEAGCVRGRPSRCQPCSGRRRRPCQAAAPGCWPV